jgi:hypothetical protein
VGNGGHHTVRNFVNYIKSYDDAWVTKLRLIIQIGEQEMHTEY